MVGDIYYPVIDRRKLGIDDADGADRALLPAGLDVIADLEGAAGEQHYAAGQVGKRVLDGQREGQSDDAEEGHQRGYVDAQPVAHDEHDDEPHDGVYHLHNKAGQAAVEMGMVEGAPEEAGQHPFDYDTGQQGGDGIEYADKRHAADDAGCVGYRLIYIFHGFVFSPRDPFCLKWFALRRICGTLA